VLYQQEQRQDELPTVSCVDLFVVFSRKAGYPRVTFAWLLVAVGCCGCDHADDGQTKAKDL